MSNKFHPFNILHTSYVVNKSSATKWVIAFLERSRARTHIHTFTFISASYLHGIRAEMCARARVSLANWIVFKHVNVKINQNCSSWTLKYVRNKDKNHVAIYTKKYNLLIHITLFYSSLFHRQIFLSFSLFFFSFSFHSHQKFFANNTWLDEMSSNRTKLTNGIIIVFFFFQILWRFWFSYKISFCHLFWWQTVENYSQTFVKWILIDRINVRPNGVYIYSIQSLWFATLSIDHHQPWIEVQLLYTTH